MLLLDGAAGSDMCDSVDDHMMGFMPNSFISPFVVSEKRYGKKIAVKGMLFVMRFYQVIIRRS